MYISLCLNMDKLNIVKYNPHNFTMNLSMTIIDVILTMQMLTHLLSAHIRCVQLYIHSYL